MTTAGGTTTTIDYGAGTTILSSTPVDRGAISPGDYSYVVDDATPGGVAHRIVVADHALPFLDADCSWSPPSTAAGPTA